MAGVQITSVLRERLPQALVAAALSLFFFFGLLWPMGQALRDAVYTPARKEKVREVPATPGPGTRAETLAEFSKRVNVGEEELRALNPAAAVPLQPRRELVLASSRWTLEHLLGLFAWEAPQWRWILNSLLLAAAVTALCMLVSYPLAWWQARTSFPGKTLLGALLLLPLVLPPFVGAIGLRRMFSRYGAFNLLLMHLGVLPEDSPLDFLGAHRWLCCVLVMALHFYPLLYLNLAAAMGNLDPSLLESARSLGQKPWQVFRRVVLPLSLPGLVAGGSLVFIGAFTDLGTPLVLGYSEVVPNQIFSLVNEQTMNPAGPALVAVVTALVLALFGLTRLVSSRAGRGGGGGVKGTSRGAETSLRGWRAAAVFIFHGAVVLFAILPHLAVILGGLGERWFGTVLPESWTLEHLREALLHPIAQQGVRNSLLYASASTVLDVLLGLACAWVIVRRGGWAGRFCDALSLAPLAIPGLVLAFGYVAVYSGWYQSTPAVLPVGFFLVLSYAVRRLPYAVRACVAGLEQTPASLEEAARGLGARTGRVLSKITVPLIAANVAAGALLAFAFAMLEVSESLILANRPVDYPLTKAIYHLFGRVGDGDQIASALGLFALLFLSLSLLAAGAFLGRKWGEMFKG